MGQTFKEKYEACKTWHDKVLVMEIFHLAMRARDSNWTVFKTANEFGCSVGLVSENLKIAQALHKHPQILQSPNRADALNRLKEYSV